MEKDECVLYAGLHCEELKEKENKIFALQEFVKLVAEMHPDSNPLPFIKKAQEFVQKIHPLFEQILNSFASHPAPASQEGVEEAAKGVFNEKTLRKAIADKWGVAGAHIDVFDSLVNRWQSSQPTEGCRWVNSGERMPSVIGEYIVVRNPQKPTEKMDVRMNGAWLSPTGKIHWYNIPPENYFMYEWLEELPQSSLPQTGQANEIEFLRSENERLRGIVNAII